MAAILDRVPQLKEGGYHITASALGGRETVVSPTRDSPRRIASQASGSAGPNRASGSIRVCLDVTVSVRASAPSVCSSRPRAEGNLRPRRHNLLSAPSARRREWSFRRIVRSGRGIVRIGAMRTPCLFVTAPWQGFGPRSTARGRQKPETPGRGRSGSHRSCHDLRGGDPEWRSRPTGGATCPNRKCPSGNMSTDGQATSPAAGQP